MKKLAVIAVCVGLITTVKAQPWFKRVDSIGVSISSNTILFPWVGGLNNCQFSQIDLNNDGIKDLFVFDRSGNRISTFINNGTANKVDYTFAPQYRDKFPVLQNWVLLADYNCDGKEDIFTYADGGMMVYRNDSGPGIIKFTLITPLLLSDYHSKPFNPFNLYVNNVDIPAITDMDGDGDLDIVTMSVMGTFFEYHQNMSKEMKGNCDTLYYQLASACWGNFAEAQLSNAVSLGQSCKVAQYDPGSVDPSQIMHAGACELCLDVDGDGDKEIVIGGVSANNMTLVVNGGSKFAANMTSQDPNYPPSTPVNMTIFPCAFYLDVDNDGLKDMLVSPNAANASENFTSVLMYKNTGTTNNVTFTFQKNNFLQDQMIDVGEGAMPVFFDHDGDGLKDMLVSNYRYYATTTLQSKIALFKNTGTLSKPSFTLITRDYQNLGSLNIISMAPAFGDLDGDGDLDMMIGDNYGYLNYFTNTPSAGVANFSLTKPQFTDSAGAKMDAGNYASPQLIDVDRDGKLDLVIGNSGGKLVYYHNNGTVNTPVFAKRSANFGGVNVIRKSTQSITGYSMPYMYDDAGSYKLIIGSECGYLYYYNNIDGNLSGNFTLVDSSYQKIWEGARTAPAGTDINNDGLLDLAVANYAGGLAWYYGQVANSVPVIDRQKFSFNIFPDPASDNLTIDLHTNKGNAAIEMIDMLGREVKQFNSAESIIHTDVSSLPPGIYLCKVSLRTNDGRDIYSIKQFAVQH